MMTGTDSAAPLAYRRTGAAAQLGVSVDTLDRLVASGAIRATKVRTATVITRTELERYLASLAQQ